MAMVFSNLKGIEDPKKLAMSMLGGEVPTAAPSNSYLTQGNDYLSQAAGILGGQSQYNPESDPVYASAKASAARNASDASNRNLADMNRRGIMNSTITSDRGARIQQEAEQKVTDLIPQLANNYQNQRQSQFANYSNMANMMLNAGQNEQSRMDRNSQFDLTRTDRNNQFDLTRTDQLDQFDLTRSDRNSQFDKTFGMQESALTGNYVPEQAQKILQEMLGLKQQAESPGVTPEQMQTFKGQGDSYRNQLSGMGIDPNIVGADKNYGQAQQNVSNYRGTPTIDLQKLLYGSILDTGDQYGSLPQGSGDLIGQLPAFSALSSMYSGLEGQPNLKSKGITNDLNYKNSSLEIERQNANTSAANGAATRANLAADNTRSDDAIKQSAAQRDFSGLVAGELGQAKSRDDVIKFFNANAAEIAKTLGSDALTKMKNDALAPFDKVTPNDKQDQSIREKAIAAAQKDYRWGLDGTDTGALIKEYESYYQ